jgi:hypothetical protein
MLVDVIGLHAVQFGNDWMKKNSEDYQYWTRSQAQPETILAVSGIFPNWTRMLSYYVLIILRNLVIWTVCKTNK